MFWRINLLSFPHLFFAIQCPSGCSILLLKSAVFIDFTCLPADEAFINFYNFEIWHLFLCRWICSWISKCPWAFIFEWSHFFYFCLHICSTNFTGLTSLLKSYDSLSRLFIILYVHCWLWIELCLLDGVPRRTSTDQKKCIEVINLIFR